MGFSRFDRINEELKKALSEIIREMKDPRISPLTTVMRAEATNDLKQCKVMISVYDKDDEARRETVAQLNRAEGFIAREVGRRVDLRHIPTFEFKLDDSIEYSVRISEILTKLSAERKESVEEDV
jgi:ribosome-binding factor A